MIFQNQLLYVVLQIPQSHAENKIQVCRHFPALKIKFFFQQSVQYIVIRIASIKTFVNFDEDYEVINGVRVRL